MGSGGSIEMKITDELDDAKEKTLIKKHSSQPQNVLPALKGKVKNVPGGMRQSQSLFSIDTTGSPGTSLQVPVAVRKENELKITKDQEIQALLKKEQKLDTENSRLRAELHALNRLCQKLRTERDTATESCHDATHRAISLEQDREKIQRQFKIFRETKESEIQALLQEKRTLEADLHRMQAHGVATGDDHKFKSSIEVLKEHVVIPGSPTPLNWWEMTGSETSSLFGSYAQIRNALPPEGTGSITDLKSMDENSDTLSDANWKMINFGEFDSGGILPDYTDLEHLEHNSLRCYVTGTPDCHREVTTLLKCDELRRLKDCCQIDGYYFSIFAMEKSLHHDDHLGLDYMKMVEQAMQISDLIVFFLGHEIGRYTELEYRAAETIGNKTSICYFLREQTENNTTSKSGGCSRVRAEVLNSDKNSQTFERCSDGVLASLREIVRMTRLELGVDIDKTSVCEELGSVDDMQLDNFAEQEQRELATVRGNRIKPVGFHKYYERLDDFVSSPGPTPPLLISGQCGSGKTTLIQSWIDRLRTVDPNFVIFQHFVTSESATSECVIMIRRLLYQICAHLPTYLAAPSFIVSTYDLNCLKLALPKWLERLSTMNSKQIILAIDSMDMIQDASKHFKWLLDPLPVGMRVIISVDQDACPAVWTQWPTLHLEPLSVQGIRHIMTEVLDNEKQYTGSLLEKKIISHCTTANTNLPLYVILLLKILCSNNEQLLQCSLKTQNCSELYLVLLKHIEDCLIPKFQNSLRLIFKLISCSRSGLNENDLLEIFSKLSWQTWLCIRLSLTRYYIIVERAGLIRAHNSLISSILVERYVDEKARKSCTRLLIEHFTKQSPKFRKTAEILPWLMYKAESVEKLRQCLLQPDIFYNLYTSGRTGEIVQYWQYIGEDKGGIGKQYRDSLASLHVAGQTKLHSNTEKTLNIFSESMDSEGDCLTVASVYESVGRFLRDLNLMDDAVTFIERSLEIRESELDPDHHLVANSLHYLGTIYAKWKKYSMAEPLLKHALELVECIVSREHPRVLQEMQSLCFVIRKQAHHEQADLIAKQMTFIEDRNGGLPLTTARFLKLKKTTARLEELATEQESIGIANALNKLGLLCYMQKNYSSAESFLKRSLSMREKLLGDSHTEVAQCFHNLSVVYAEQKLFFEAADFMKKSLEIRRKLLGEYSPVVLSTARHLAVLCKRSQRHELARSVYRELLHISNELYGEDSSAAATAMVNLAVVESELGCHVTALPLYKQALAVYEVRHGPASKEVADTLRNIAILRYHGKNYEEAANLYKKSMLIREKLQREKREPWT